MSERYQPERTHLPESGSELDALIQSSIATYGEPAPNSDLAQRVLMRIAAEPEPTPARRWLPWAIALPIAASLITIFMLFETRPVHAPAGLEHHAQIPLQLHNNITAAQPYQSKHENRETLARHELRPRLATVASTTQPLPKHDVFPTPQPLTPAEQALVNFVSRAPASERNSLIEAQQQPNTPLTIAAITIQPIEVPELGTN